MLVATCVIAIAVSASNGNRDSSIGGDRSVEGGASGSIGILSNIGVETSEPSVVETSKPSARHTTAVPTMAPITNIPTENGEC